jgi:hypothetical protein
MFRIYHARFSDVFPPFVAKCHRRARRPLKVPFKEFHMIVILTFIVSLFLGAPPAMPGPAGQRFATSCAAISSRGSPVIRRGWTRA